MNSKKIAEIAGVSRATVSKVINGYANISEETKKKVMQVINEYDYVPNLSAQMMAGKKSGTIGLFLYNGNEHGNTSKIEDSLYLSQFIAQIVDEASEIGYTVNVSNFYRGSQNFKTLFRNKSIDGGIFVSCASNMEELTQIAKEGFKVVLIGYSPEFVSKNVSVVNPANFKGSFDATEHLILNNHKDILHIIGDLERFSGVERKKGFQEALKKHGIPFGNDNFIIGNLNENLVYLKMKKYLEENRTSRATAIFSSTDNMAFGAIRAIKESGLRIPEDISIIGFDNTITGRYITPALSTVGYLDNKIAKISVNQLKDMINGEVGKLEEIELKFVERESVINNHKFK